MHHDIAGTDFLGGFHGWYAAARAAMVGSPLF
jgi:hypothetical protein